MVSGTQWPGGDPFLQRQNEPSMAVSSRNPLHLVAGDNDYRSVDLPFVTGAEETGDAWLGFFTSFDGGQDLEQCVGARLSAGHFSARQSLGYGLNAGADPVVRAGTNGMFYYSGLAFDRNDQSSSVFVARYIDDNNIEGGNSIRYISTSVGATGNTNNFLDKREGVAVDIPRAGAKTCVYSGPWKHEQTRIISRRSHLRCIYPVQWPGSEERQDANIMFSESSDCGVTWSTPIKMSGTARTNQGAAIAIDPNTGIVYIVWRVFASSNAVDSIQGVALLGGLGSLDLFTPVINVTPITPFDQGTTDVSFRTNAYPAITVDDHSNVYLAWSQRTSATSATGGDARITLMAAGPTYKGSFPIPTGVKVTG